MHDSKYAFTHKTDPTYMHVHNMHIQLCVHTHTHTRLVHHKSTHRGTHARVVATHENIIQAHVNYNYV